MIGNFEFFYLSCAIWYNLHITLGRTCLAIVEEEGQK